MIREGATVVVAGRPNVGKSSIFNMLAGSDRAIVTAIAGTTRDLVSDQVNIDGLAVTLVDTAGWRDTLDLIEREGVARGERARAAANLLVLVLDRSEPIKVEDRQLIAQTEGQPRIVVANKSDRPAAFDAAKDAIGAEDVISVSAITGAGADELRRGIVRELTGSESLRDTAALSNVRHIALIEHARTSLVSAEQAVGTGAMPEEFVLADLQAARARLEEIVGVRASEDLLQHIFETFCIGK